MSDLRQADALLARLDAIAYLAADLPLGATVTVEMPGLDADLMRLFALRDSQSVTREIEVWSDRTLFEVEFHIGNVRVLAQRTVDGEAVAAARLTLIREPSEVPRSNSN